MAKSNCPNCGKSYRFPSAWVGRTVACPGCRCRLAIRLDAAGPVLQVADPEPAPVAASAFPWRAIGRMAVGIIGLVATVAVIGFAVVNAKKNAERRRIDPRSERGLPNREIVYEKLSHCKDRHDVLVRFGEPLGKDWSGGSEAWYYGPQSFDPAFGEDDGPLIILFNLDGSVGDHVVQQSMKQFEKSLERLRRH